MKLLGTYQNGNYSVMLLEDGTKVRRNNLDHFDAQFPENIDIKITNYCDMNCSYCHEDSTTKGKHGEILNATFIDTLHPYTELAIGGGNPLSHPDLVPFLEKVKEKKAIANITINQTHFENSQPLVKYLVDNELIKGLGVSLTRATPLFTQLAKQYSNLVIHIINGITTERNIMLLAHHDLKLLILGYKDFRRGITFKQNLQQSKYITDNQSWLYDNLNDLFSQFNVVSFDNLALEQLEVQRLMSSEDWQKFYMGDDGSHTMYIDMVKQEFARCSVEPVRHNLLNHIEDMFKVVKESSLK